MSSETDAELDPMIDDLIVIERGELWHIFNELGCRVRGKDTTELHIEGKAEPEPRAMILVLYRGQRRWFQGVTSEEILTKAIGWALRVLKSNTARDLDQLRGMTDRFKRSHRKPCGYCGNRFNAAELVTSLDMGDLCVACSAANIDREGDSENGTT